MTVSSTLAAALESALNLYLEQDTGALQRATGLRGKCIALSITGTALTFYFLPDTDGVQVLSHYEGDVDTWLSGSPLGFARLNLSAREDALFEGAVRIEGNTDIGEQFQALLAGVDLDWEEKLSHITGDVIAHQAGKLVKNAKRFVNDGRETLIKDSGEYLQEEARLLPAHAEMEYFLTDVDTLRADVDRLEARVYRLLKAEEGSS